MAVHGVSRATRDLDFLLELYAGGPQDAWDVDPLLAGGTARGWWPPSTPGSPRCGGFAAGVGAHRRAAVE
jgi:hypothetical protein